jgi:hypothetical protein
MNFSKPPLRLHSQTVSKFELKTHQQKEHRRRYKQRKADLYIPLVLRSQYQQAVQHATHPI